MPYAPTGILGLSLSPTYVTAVRVSVADFAVTSSTERPLPAAVIAHDGRRILDSPALVPIVRALLAEVAESQEELDAGIYLSIHTPSIFTQRLPCQNAAELDTAVRQQATVMTGFAGRPPIVRYTPLDQREDAAVVSFAAIEASLVEDYAAMLMQAGTRLRALDLIPLSILRGMAASGVLDALLRKIGQESAWGCFGLAGSQTWITIWQGTSLRYFGNVSTPTDATAWERCLIDAQASSGLEKLALWFSWTEPGIAAPIDPLQLKIGTPIRPAVLGPLYGHPPGQPPMSALGSALKIEFAFPLGWDFRDAYVADTAPTPPPQTQVPITSEVLEPEFMDFSATTSTPQNTVITSGIHRMKRRSAPMATRMARLAFRGAFCLLLLVFLAGTFFAWRSSAMDDALEARNATISASFQTVRKSNYFFLRSCEWLASKALPGIQVESFTADQTRHLSISGQAYDKAKITQFLALLALPGSKIRVRLDQQDTTALNTMPASYRFTASGTVLPPEPVRRKAQ